MKSKESIKKIKTLLNLKTIGKVKWFNESKGMGFITCTGYNKDIEVSTKYIIMDGYKTLAEGQGVELEVKDLEDGTLIAVNVKPIKT